MTKLEQLKALGAAKQAARNSSDDGGESIAAKTGNKAGSIPAEAGCPTASRLARAAVRGAALQPCAGVATSSSETKPKRTKVKTNSGAPTASRRARATKPPQPPSSPNIKKRGRPKIEGQRPWEIAGKPRRTWYNQGNHTKKATGKKERRK